MVSGMATGDIPAELHGWLVYSSPDARPAPTHREPQQWVSESHSTASCTLVRYTILFLISLMKQLHPVTKSMILKVA